MSNDNNQLIIDNLDSNKKHTLACKTFLGRKTKKIVSNGEVVTISTSYTSFLILLIYIFIVNSVFRMDFFISNRLYFYIFTAACLLILFLLDDFKIKNVANFEGENK